MHTHPNGPTDFDPNDESTWEGKIVDGHYVPRKPGHPDWGTPATPAGKPKYSSRIGPPKPRRAR